MAALSKIREAGFHVALVGDGFEIEPASALTQNQRDFLKSHKAEIIEELQAENNRFVVECWTPAGGRMLVQADSAEHAAFLARMNPKPLPDL